MEADGNSIEIIQLLLISIFEITFINNYYIILEYNSIILKNFKKINYT